MIIKNNHVWRVYCASSTNVGVNCWDEMFNHDTDRITAMFRQLQSWGPLCAAMTAVHCVSLLPRWIKSLRWNFIRVFMYGETKDVLGECLLSFIFILSKMSGTEHITVFCVFPLHPSCYWTSRSCSAAVYVVIACWEPKLFCYLSPGRRINRESGQHACTAPPYVGAWHVTLKKKNKSTFWETLQIYAWKLQFVMYYVCYANSDI